MHFLTIPLIFCTLTSITGQPRVSVLTLIDNKSFVGEFIKDISRQTIFQDCEILLINTDESSSLEPLLEPLLREFSNIRYFHSNQKTTLCCLLNEAIKAANSAYLTLAVPEDTRNPEALALLAEQLDNDTTIDLVYGDYWSTWKPCIPFESDQKWNFVPMPEFYPQLLYFPVMGDQYMWRKSMHQKYGILNEYFFYTSMWEFFNRAAYQGAVYKKAPIITGVDYINYFTPKKIFLTDKDYEKWYHEDKYIRNTYKSLWQTDFPARTEKPFVIITASYNNKHWYKRNLDSGLNQQYSNFRIIYVDDASPDDTGNLVEQYLAAQHQQDHVTLIKNTQRMGALANVYKAAHLCKPEEIILIVDGDDWLANDHVLAYLNAVYSDPNVWLTYGQFVWFPEGIKGFSSPMPEKIIANNEFRSCWVTSHLRTFYAALFQKINREDLLYDGNFLVSAGDIAIMFPMLEMAGYHVRFIPEILYVYNCANSLNDHKVNHELQSRLCGYVTHKNRYQPLMELF